MLKMASKQSMLLLGAVMALCAFVLPSVASATSWSPVGTTDGRLDSSNLGFSIPAINSGTACSAATFSVTVDTATVATVTGVSIANCHGVVGGPVGCTMTATATNLPWRATAVDTTNIQIHGFDLDVSFETTPGTLNECANSSLNMRLTGTVTASFAPGAAGSRTADFTGATGLIAHVSGVGSFATAAVGSAVPTGLLNIIM